MISIFDISQKQFIAQYHSTIFTTRHQTGNTAAFVALTISRRFQKAVFKAAVEAETSSTFSFLKIFQDFQKIQNRPKGAKLVCFCFALFFRGKIQNVQNQNLLCPSRSISYVSRKYARLRLDTPTPGVYYVMIRGDADETDLTVTASLLPRGHAHAGDALWRSGRRMTADYYQTSGDTLVLTPARQTP